MAPTRLEVARQVRIREELGRLLWGVVRGDISPGVLGPGGGGFVLVSVLNADLGNDGGHTAVAESRRALCGCGHGGNHECAVLPLAEQEVVESSMVVVETVLNGLEGEGGREA